MVGILSPPYYINSFTMLSVPAVFLFMRLAAHFFTSALVNSLCNPSKPRSSLSGTPTFASVWALISVSNSSSSVSLAERLARLRGNFYKCVPLPLRGTIYFTVLWTKCSYSPLCLAPSIPSILTHTYFISPSKFSTVTKSRLSIVPWSSYHLLYVVVQREGGVTGSHSYAWYGRGGIFLCGKGVLDDGDI